MDQLVDDTVQLISCDVFDTLLLRTPRSSRTRMRRGEELFSAHLRRHGFHVAPDELVEARIAAEHYAYRALTVGGGLGEVRLHDLIRRQLAILGLPESMAAVREGLEIQVEKSSLHANLPLANLVRRHKASGKRVIAVSDTALAGDAVAELLAHFHGPGLVDRIYSSADALASKRSGLLFSLVSSREGVAPSRMLHIGDDALADHAVPRSLGIQTAHIARPVLQAYLRRADGARTAMTGQIRNALRRGIPNHVASTQAAFGREVFGPIVGQLCLAIWLYAKQVEVNRDAVLLFCARGGLGIREAFERVLERFRLELALPRENVMISRLVAARTAVHCRSEVLLDELQREFRTQTFADVAAALGGRQYELSGDWQRPFSKIEFFGMLDRPEARAIVSDIDHQRRLFESHLSAAAGSARRIILCDTGLYGSTQRLLMEGMPQRNFETIQFARCDYKGLGEQHFSRVTGLIVEDNLYNPLRIQSVVLRYWQMIEALFEPSIPSVRELRENADGSVTSNAGSITHAGFDPSTFGPLLRGALQYIDEAADGLQVIRDADQAWRTLKQAGTRPTASDMLILGTGDRSVDFGRSETVSLLSGASRVASYQKIKSIKSQLWREAAITRDFPYLKSPLLLAMETAHLGRRVSSCIRPRHGGKPQ